MCEPGDTFRFCTCADDEELRRPLWILHRRDESLTEHIRRGRVSKSTQNDDEVSIQASLLDALRNGDCFDFEYVPALGDVFIAQLEGRRPPNKRASEYRYRYFQGLSGRLRWQIDTSNHLAGWRLQMVEIGVGPIECD